MLRLDRQGRLCLDAQPLLDWIDEQHGILRGWGKWDEYADEQEAARRRIDDARENGFVYFAQADKICCVLGIHPCLVWGDDYWDFPLTDHQRRAVRQRMIADERLARAT